MISQAKQIEVIAAVIINRDGDFLICKRPSNKRHGELWEFPGGKVHCGESHAEAIKRELYEELRVATTHVGKPIDSIQDNGSDFIIIFMPVEIEGEPSLREHSEYTWCTLDKLLEYLFIEILTGLIKSCEPMMHFHSSNCMVASPNLMI